ncbi:MAG: type I polyketide synthase, partial [bacterium]|nr:type I polyketide synthase [bacterium]
MNSETNNTGLEVAVIGMAARFPGAGNVDEYWDNVRNGRETIRFYTDEEMEEAGVEAGLLKNPDYIKAAAELENIENFDAAFFGYSPAEAQIMDPQMRFLHEVAWDALEDAGYVPEDYEGLIGMYSGAPFSMDWVARTMIHPRDETIDDMNFGFLTSKDHLSTRISYLFNLKGPSFTFYSACSTSLVGIHLACQGLLSGECDMALAGGVSILLPQRKGYLYREDMVYSKDGHVRPFDTDASGIVGGNGIGIVVLKPLEDAEADGDHIYAIVKGTGINNDGSRKIGYTAPSITGQEVLFREVREAAEIEAESITFVECHGTATPLGDPVEIAALTRAFDTGKRNYCALGSVKSNMGHTDSAAGVAGFIKAVLALYYKQIPPTLHFRTPNPKLEMHNSPFYVNTELIEWRNEDYPLRAAVNSLGLGGTNAHAILQEAPVLEKAAAPDKAYRLYPVSARTPGALEKRVEGLAHYLEKHPGLDMAQVAYTLQVGRSAMRNRRAFVSNSREDLLKQLREPETAPVRPFFTGEKERSLVFMFSGQGSQYVNMGLDLYKTEEKFRKEIDHAFEILKGQINEDLKYILYPETEQQEREAEEKINRLYYTQPVKFIFEYTLARLLMSWGLEPRAMVGHSFGEYVLAALAVVFTLEDALELVMIRGEEFKRIQPGQMLSVSLSEEELRPLLPAQVAVAAVNTTGHCMVAGPLEAVEAFG